SQGKWYSFDRYSGPNDRPQVVSMGRYGDMPLMANICYGLERVVWRPTTGEWMGYPGVPFAFGVYGDVPVPSDYLGRGRDNFAVWRPSDGTWHITDALAACIN